MTRLASPGLNTPAHICRQRPENLTSHKFIKLFSYGWISLSIQRKILFSFPLFHLVDRSQFIRYSRVLWNIPSFWATCVNPSQGRCDRFSLFYWLRKESRRTRRVEQRHRRFCLQIPECPWRVETCWKFNFHSSPLLPSSRQRRRKRSIFSLRDFFYRWKLSYMLCVLKEEGLHI